MRPPGYKKAPPFFVTPSPLGEESLSGFIAQGALNDNKGVNSGIYPAEALQRGKPRCKRGRARANRVIGVPGKNFRG
jgi:hypothetical protein